jgi:uncharacterized protein
MVFFRRIHSTRQPVSGRVIVQSMSDFSRWSRRRFLLTTGGLAAAVAGGVGFDAFEIAPNQIQVPELDLEVPDLPRALQGLRIAVITDVHLYHGLHRPARLVMQLVGAVQPDIVVVDGDLCENLDQLKPLHTFLLHCRGRLGTFVTMGNWERQVGLHPSRLREVCSRAGVDFLLNESRVVSVEGSRLTILGLDDPVLGSPDPVAALRQAPAGVPALWLFHAPGYADRLPPDLPRPMMMLAGHTHGGQIRLPGIPPVLPVGAGRFVAGWYRDLPAPLYVSRGVGTTGIHARLNCPPEVPIVVLGTAGPGPRAV